MPVQNSSSPRFSPALALAAGAGFALLGGCGFAADGNSAQASDPEPNVELAERVRQTPIDAPQDCLLVIWDAQDNPDREYDRAHDEVEGGAISCATGTSASEYDATLAAIRAAAAANDRAALIRELGIPLLYIDRDGQRRDVLADELLESGFDEVFTPEMIALMRDLRLEEMTVVPDQGAFFELGSVWLAADRPGGRPRLVTVNRQAMEEAAEAARRAAAGEG